MARGTKKDELSFACYMILEDGSSVPWDSLSPEQIRRFRERAAQRLSANMSEFYMQHPDEANRIESKG